MALGKIVFGVSLLVHCSGSVPVCTEPYSHVEVAEDTPIATVVKEITCSPSGTGSLSYEIRDGNTHGKFGINNVNGKGKVFVQQSISFESRVTQFQLTILVSESRPYTTSVDYVVDIQITGINDYAPLFLFSPYTVYVNEDKPPGSVISSPIPYDFDKGDDGITTSVILDGGDPLFYMDPQTARVYLRSGLDYERQTVYVLTIQVTDNGLPDRRTSTTLLTIHVKDRNDNTPACEEPYITETFDETKPAESVIKLLKCSDEDEGNNGRLSYDIGSGDYTKFRLQGPYLLLAESIDVDTEPHTWMLTIIVQDRGTPRLKTLVDVVIYVNGIDDNVPQWAPPEYGIYIIDVKEHSSIGTHVVRVSALDADGDERDAGLLYYMDTFTHVFTLKPNTGDIFVNADIDREVQENYTVQVSAVSRANRLDKVTTAVAINIIDINDNPPVFETDVREIYVPEDQSRLSTITTVGATDADTGSNGQLRYRMIDGDQDIFEVATHSGHLKLRRSLDYEKDTVHVLTVQATDGGNPPRSATTSIIVSVLPVNEFSPEFTDLSIVSVMENTAVGTSLFQVRASDRDMGKDGVVSFTITPHTDVFTIETASGILRLIGKLDREVQSTYEIIVVAEDHSETKERRNTASVSLSVLDENDHQPECQFMYFVTLSQPFMDGYEVTRLNCTDSDMGLNALLLYRITSGNSNADFMITDDGVVHATKKLSQTQYHLQITISDAGSPARHTETSVIISAIGRPTLSNLPTNVSFSEATPIGTMLFQIGALGTSDQLEFNIVSINALPSVSDWPVRLDKMTGIFYLFDEFDREITKLYVIEAIVTDTLSGLHETGRLDINVVDVNDNTPQFDKSFYNISVVENVQVGTVLLQAVATDTDSGKHGEIVYEIYKGNGTERFLIDKHGSVTLKSTLDREKMDAIIMIITATDKGEPVPLTGSATVLISIVDVDEYIPEFVNLRQGFELLLSENTPLGTTVMTATARDLDSNSMVTYSINTSLSSGHFVIGSLTGELVLFRFLDRESQDIMTTVILAKTNNRTVIGSLKVIVTDENDNDPQFGANVYNFRIQEKAMPGDLIGEIDVSDRDAEENGLVSLGIIKGNADGTFIMLGHQLYLNMPVAYDRNDNYLLTVKAKDNGSPNREASASVIILVMPEYKQPKFVSSHELIEVPENLHMGQILFDADATNLEATEGNAGDIMYEMTTTNQDTCIIDPISGQITLINALHIEDGNTEIIIQIVARNVFNPNLRDSMILKVDIVDTNDHEPAFEQNVYSFNVKENDKLGTSIGTLTAKDADSAENAYITYQLRSISEEMPFEIDSVNGAIVVKYPLDFEQTSAYLFNVVATDHGSPSLSGTAYVNIQVVDVNDNPPVFDRGDCSIEISEDTPTNSALYQVHAFDEDTGVNGEIMYRIKNARETVLQVDRDTGDLFLTEELDREAIQNFTMTVSADDRGSPTLSTSLGCSIHVEDVNDNAPLFDLQTYSSSLSRSIPAGTIIVTTSAFDTDEGLNSQIQYSLINEPTARYFQINQRGEISTVSELLTVADRLTVKVIAADKGIPSLSTTATVNIDMFPSNNVETDFIFEVSENSTPNSFVGRVGAHSDYRYTVVGGNINATFRVVESTGSIFLNKVVDRETLSDYVLMLTFSHSAAGSSIADVTVHVSILDENDNDPTFESSQYDFNMMQYTPEGYEIGEVTASDNDAGQNGEIEFNIDCMGWTNLFKISMKGVIRLQKPPMYVSEAIIACVVIAKDRGMFPRTGTANVSVTIIKVDPILKPVPNETSGVISLEIPSGLEVGHTVATLSPDMFGIDSSRDKVSYLSNDQSVGFDVDKTSGDILVSDSTRTISSSSVFIWVVAAMTNAQHVRNLALVRIDSFVPSLHVMVLSHEVSLEVMELNKQSFLRTIQALFSSGRVVIWKLEGDIRTGRRRLLFRSSRSYIYVVKDDTVDRLDGIEMAKQYLTQGELADVLMADNGDVSDELTHEQFDNFTIYLVEAYEDQVDEQEATGALTVPALIGIVAAVILGICLLAAVYALVKKNWSHVSCSPLKRVAFNQIQKASDVESNACFSALKKPTDKAVPSMTSALDLVNFLTEDEKHVLMNRASVTATQTVETTLHTSRVSSQTLEEELDQIEHLNNGSTDQPQSAPETKKWRDRWRLTTNKVMVQSHASIDETVDKLPVSKCDVMPADVKSLSSEDIIQPLTAPPKPPNLQPNVSPPILKLKETLAKPIMGLDNSTIVIGGKEFNGVGKDTTTNQKYFYNTRTGDKLLVTDNILRRAIEQRQSVVGPEFDQSRNRVRFSTFKRPMRRKMSRTRFSTTTIWEMAIDEGNEDTEHVDDIKRAYVDSAADQFESEKHRRFGVANSPSFTKERSSTTTLSDVDESEVSTSTDTDTETETEETPRKLAEPKRKISQDYMSDAAEGPKTSRMTEVSFETMSPSTVDDNDVFVTNGRNYDDNDPNVDGTATKTSHDPAWANRKSSISVANEGEVLPESVGQAGKVMRFTRPVYKPVNLDNVQCKVPKGRSDPKDCLAKDPVYVGWAKVVGRRASKKVSRRRDEPEVVAHVQQITESADVTSYTKAVANRTPPHMTGKKLFRRGSSEETETY